MFLLKVLEWATTKSEPKDMKLLTLFGRCSHLYFRPFFDRHVKMEDRFRGSRLARCSDGQGPKLKHAMKKSTKGAGRGGRGRSGRGRGGRGRGGRGVSNNGNASNMKQAATSNIKKVAAAAAAKAAAAAAAKAAAAAAAAAPTPAPAEAEVFMPREIPVEPVVATAAEDPAQVVSEKAAMEPAQPATPLAAAEASEAAVAVEEAAASAAAASTPSPELAAKPAPTGDQQAATSAHLAPPAGPSSMSAGEARYSVETPLKRFIVQSGHQLSPAGRAALSALDLPGSSLVIGRNAFTLKPTAGCSELVTFAEGAQVSHPLDPKKARTTAVAPLLSHTPSKLHAYLCH